MSGIHLNSHHGREVLLSFQTLNFLCDTLMPKKYYKKKKSEEEKTLTNILKQTNKLASKLRLALHKSQDSQESGLVRVWQRECL